MVRHEIGGLSRFACMRWTKPIKLMMVQLDPVCVRGQFQYSRALPPGVPQVHVYKDGIGFQRPNLVQRFTRFRVTQGQAAVIQETNSSRKVLSRHGRCNRIESGRVKDVVTRLTVNDLYLDPAGW